MLFKIALALLIGWILGVVGVYDLGESIHGLLLAGLMLLLLNVLRAREALIASEREAARPREARSGEAEVPVPRTRAGGREP